MSFTRAYIAGDSLFDTGAFFLDTFGLTGGGFVVPDPLLGYQARFSDGPTTAEVAAGLLGAEVAADPGALIPEDPTADIAVGAFALQGVDLLRPESSFAIGSARAVGGRSVEDILTEALAEVDPDGLALLLALLTDDQKAYDVNLGAQAERLAAALADDPSPQDAIAAFLIGLNDFAAFAPTAPETAAAEALALAAEVVGATAAAAQLAFDGGVGAVALLTLPDFSFFPPVPGVDPTPEQRALERAAIDAHEAGLREAAADFVEAGLDARIVDLRAMAAEVEADPGVFGLASLDVTTVLGFGSGGPINPEADAFAPDELGFYDFSHFSAALHGVFGAFMAASLEASRTEFLGDGRDVARAAPGEGALLAFGGGGRDKLFGRNGDDGLFGGEDRDLMHGRAGDDVLSGGAGRDKAFGGKGDDLIAGGGARDHMLGGAGSDVLILGAGDPPPEPRGNSGGNGRGKAKGKPDDKGGPVKKGPGEFAFGGGGDDLVIVDLDDPSTGGRLKGGRGEDILLVLGAEEGGLRGQLREAGFRVQQFEVVTDSLDGLLAEGDARAEALALADLWGFV